MQSHSFVEVACVMAGEGAIRLGDEALAECKVHLAALDAQPGDWSAGMVQDAG